MTENVRVCRANWSDLVKRKQLSDFCLIEMKNEFSSRGNLEPGAWARIGKEIFNKPSRRLKQKKKEN